MKQRTAILLSLFLVLAGTGCASAKRDSYATYSRNGTAQLTNLTVQLQPQESVDVRGVYDANDSVGTGGMMYSGAAGAGGAVAQLLIHAAVSSTAQERKLAAQQSEADKVLIPFQEHLALLSAQSLLHTDSRYSFGEQAPSGDAQLLSRPIFYLTQDSRRVSVIHVVEVRGANPKGDPIYSNVIEVLGPLLPQDSATEVLLSSTELGLEQQIVELYRQSLDLAVRDVRREFATASSPQQTFRIEGSDMARVERGSGLVSDCKFQAIRNLRGWVIAFPTEPLEDCEIS